SGPRRMTLHALRWEGPGDPLVMVVDRDGEPALRVVLPDHVLIQRFLDLPWAGEWRRSAGRFLLFFFREDLVAQRDALVADVDGRSRDEALYRVLGLPAEGTAQVLVAR